MLTFKGVFGFTKDGKNGWTMPEGKVYLVSLPLCVEIPELRERTLYVHRSVASNYRTIFGISEFERWTVTDAETGHRINGGATKKSAMANAAEQLRRAGSDGLVRAVSLAKAACLACPAR